MCLFLNRCWAVALFTLQFASAFPRCAPFVSCSFSVVPTLPFYPPQFFRCAIQFLFFSVWFPATFHLSSPQFPRCVPLFLPLFCVLPPFPFYHPHLLRCTPLFPSLCSLASQHHTPPKPTGLVFYQPTLTPPEMVLASGKANLYCRRPLRPVGGSSAYQYQRLLALANTLMLLAFMAWLQGFGNT